MRCAATNGKRWRCSQDAVEGARLCAHHRDKNREYALAHLARKSPEERAAIFRASQLRARYAIGLDDYAQMLHAQGGVCALCRQPETHVRRGKVVQLSVDHDHDTGEVRGLLCNSCNRGIGFLREDPVILARAIDYLAPRGVVS